MKSGTGAVSRVKPELSAIGLGQRAANCKPHADTTGLGAEEWLKYTFSDIGSKARAAILHCNMRHIDIGICSHENGNRRNRYARIMYGLYGVS